MLESVVNLSEGRDPATLRFLAETTAGAGRGAGRDTLLDIHSDDIHHRSVFTLAGARVEDATRLLASAALGQLDLSSHAGVHPRLGVVDVVPFVPLAPIVWLDAAAPESTATVPTPSRADLPDLPDVSDLSDLSEAVKARDRFAEWFSARGVPCFLYGPESVAAPARTLPQIRREAWGELRPDLGPRRPHPTAGACCVGARPLLVAYNLWIEAGPDTARRIAKELRGPHVRVLGLDLDGAAQVSCNLIDPLEVGPGAVYDFVAARTPIRRAELVGLVPRAVLERVGRQRWDELDLGESKTIEMRLGL